MINGKSVLGIIPARGGSKGILRKNIRLLAGKPLLAWTIEEAKKSKYMDRLILSSEDEEIINVAKKYDCEVPFVRPKEFAQDYTPSIETIIHAINALPEKYDFVCFLQPTSPLRKVEDIDGCIEKCIYSSVESCISVSEVDIHPYLMYETDNNGKLKPLFPNNIKRRQDLPTVLAINGAVYFCSAEYILNLRKLISEDAVGYFMNKVNSIDIDDEFDLIFAEFILQDKYKSAISN